MGVRHYARNREGRLLDLGNAFQLALNGLDRITGTAHTVGCVARRLRRHSVTTTRKEHLEQFRGLLVIEPTFYELVPQGRHFCDRKTLYLHMVTSDPCTFYNIRHAATLFRCRQNQINRYERNT